MKGRAAIAIFAFLVLLGLVIWAVLSGRRLPTEAIPEAAVRTHYATAADRMDVEIPTPDTALADPAAPAPGESARRPGGWADSGPPALPARLREVLDGLMNTSVPLETRRRKLAELEARADADAARVLMALGDEHTALNAAAVSALGGMKRDGVTDYLRNKVTDKDPLMIAAAVKSLARQQGEAAIPAIAAVLRKNRKRADGFDDVVCAACVEALAETHSARAIPVLDAELRETVGTTLREDYGSKIVAVLLALRKPEARSVLLAYADRLEEIQQRAPENPMGKRYLREKIEEARAAADALFP